MRPFWGGVSRQRISYDQLSLTQFVQGFSKNILDESDQKIREKMIQYLSDLMEDATDFSWASAKAKASHAVLLCEMERGSLDWFAYLGFYVAFNTVQVISRRVVGRAEETSTYSSLGFCTINCRPTASNYQLSHLRP